MKGVTINPKGFHKGQIKFYVVLIPLALFMALPIVYIISHAFKPPSELFAFPPRFFVKSPTADNFRNLAKVSGGSVVSVGRYAFNSILVTVSVVCANMVVGSMAGFALSKLDFKGKKVLFEINTLSMMFVPAAVLIPRYLVMDRIHIMDTYFAHILPLLAMPVGMFLVKQFIDQVPDALIEAAYIDGAKDFTIYRKIIIPLIKPAIATTAILAFQAVWTNIETSNLYINDESMKTLPFYLNTLANANNNVAGQGMQAAAVLIQFLPNLLMFIVLRKSFMNTMANSGIK